MWGTSASTCRVPSGPLITQPFPTPEGDLLTGGDTGGAGGSGGSGGSGDCPVVQPENGAEYGAQQRCADDGRGDTATLTVDILTGVFQVGGVPPLTLDYTVDLTLIPDGAIILCAVARYGFSPNTNDLQVSDPGGTVSAPNDFPIHWDPGSIASMKSAGQAAAYPISAEITGTASSSGQFKMESFIVRYTDATD